MAVESVTKPGRGRAGLGAKPGVLVVMGVSGAGKTTVGRLLAERLGWRFADADDYHPPANVEKMASGVPLTDEDRAPWLERLNELASESLAAAQPLVLACSALKADYRRALAAGDPRVGFVFLHGSYDLIRGRLEERQDHYMPPGLLRSQFDALEPPTEALKVNVGPPPAELVDEIVGRLELPEAS